MNLRLRGEAGIDYDDWRECHNPSCGVNFKPDTVSRYHCSEACAAACLERRTNEPFARVRGLSDGPDGPV